MSNILIFLMKNSLYGFTKDNMLIIYFDFIDLIHIKHWLEIGNKLLFIDIKTLVFMFLQEYYRSHEISKHVCYFK